jgi:hypothetical protein
VCIDLVDKSAKKHCVLCSSAECCRIAMPGCKGMCGHGPFHLSDNKCGRACRLVLMLLLQLEHRAGCFEARVLKRCCSCSFLQLKGCKYTSLCCNAFCLAVVRRICAHADELATILSSLRLSFRCSYPTVCRDNFSCR